MSRLCHTCLAWHDPTHPCDADTLTAAAQASLGQTAGTRDDQHLADRLETERIRKYVRSPFHQRRLL
jgi:hypothetical protein